MSSALPLKSGVFCDTHALHARSARGLEHDCHRLYLSNQVCLVTHMRCMKEVHFGPCCRGAGARGRGRGGRRGRGAAAGRRRVQAPARACRRAVPPRVPPRAPPRVLAARACGAGTQRCARCAAALRGGTGAAPRRLAWAARDTVPASRTSLCSTLVRCAPTPTGVADCHEYSAWSDALLGN